MIQSVQYLEQRGINASGYARAQIHYDELRKKLIRQVTTSLKDNNADKEYLMNLTQSIEQDLLNDANTNQEMTDKASKLLDKVEQMILNYIESEQPIDSQVITLLQQARDGERALSNAKSTAEERLQNRIKYRQQKILKMLPFRSVVSNIHIGSQGADMTDIFNQLYSFYTRALYKNLIDQDFKLNKTEYIQSLKGYYTEISEYKALSQYFSSIGTEMKVHHTGGIKIKSKDSELDLVITQLNDIEKVLEKNMQINVKIEALNNQNFSKSLEDLRKEIDWFGEQSKSWSLESFKFKYGIGERKNLLNNFLNEPGSSEMSALQGISFLARQKNILLSLGATNVLINIGGQRQWMSSFIANFRNMGYLLAFEGGGKNPINSHVILTRLYNKTIRTYG